MEVQRLQHAPGVDLTPEHSKRRPTDPAAPNHPDVQAAYAYVDGVVAKADLQVGNAPAWFGWALREAFLAGCSHGSSREIEAE